MRDLKTGNSPHSRRLPRRSLLARALSLEPLERRAVLCGVTCDFSDGLLTVTGTSQDDLISLKVDPSTQTLQVLDAGEMLAEYPVADVHRLRVVGLDGDDEIAFDPALAIPALVDGGSGEDAIMAALSAEHELHSMLTGEHGLIQYRDIERLEALGHESTMDAVDIADAMLEAEGEVALTNAGLSVSMFNTLRFADQATLHSSHNDSGNSFPQPGQQNHVKHDSAFALTLSTNSHNHQSTTPGMTAPGTSASTSSLTTAAGEKVGESSHSSHRNPITTTMRQSGIEPGGRWCTNKNTLVVPRPDTMLMTKLECSCEKFKLNGDTTAEVLASILAEPWAIPSSGQGTQCRLTVRGQHQFTDESEICTNGVTEEVLQQFESYRPPVEKATASPEPQLVREVLSGGYASVARWIGHWGVWMAALGAIVIHRQTREQQGSEERDANRWHGSLECLTR